MGRAARKFKREREQERNRDLKRKFKERFRRNTTATGEPLPLEDLRGYVEGVGEAMNKPMRRSEPTK